MRLIWETRSLCSIFMHMNLVKIECVSNIFAVHNILSCAICVDHKAPV